MKCFFFSLVIFISLPLHADEKKHEGKKLEEIKPEIISHLDQRISFLQEAKSCVQAAQDHKSLKECRKKLRESMKSLRKERKGPDDE